MLLVEAAHAGGGDWQAWADGLFDAAQRVFTSPYVNLGLARRERARYSALATASPNQQLTEYLLRTIATVSADVFDPFLRFPHYVGTLLEMQAQHEAAPYIEQCHALMGSADTLGVIAIAGELSVTIGAPHEQAIRIMPAERRLLTQVALHLEAGLRLRAEPQAAIAFIDANGRVVHAEGAARLPAMREGLSAHVKLVERSRTRRHRHDPEAVEAWQALISGRWALVERGSTGGARCYAVVEATRSSPLRTLSEFETRVVELSARGLTGKMVAYALGVKASAVSTQLTSAALKLGMASRTELVRLAANLLGIGPRPEASAALSPSERDVLALLRLGWSNAAIAQQRQRSERTVANQVGSLLQKLQVPSRRALAASTVDD
jgi:DNA-binding NarL/FixJ family response regulator